MNSKQYKMNKGLLQTLSAINENNTLQQEIEIISPKKELKKKRGLEGKFDQVFKSEMDDSLSDIEQESH